MPRSPTPSNTPSVWVDALCAWPTLTRCPTQASGIPFSDIVSDIAASLRGRQLRLQHSEAFAPQHAPEFESGNRRCAPHMVILPPQRQRLWEATGTWRTATCYVWVVSP